VRREKRGSREAGDQGGASVERLIFGRGGERISLARIVLAMAGRPTPAPEECRKTALVSGLSGSRMRQCARGAHASHAANGSRLPHIPKRSRTRRYRHAHQASAGMALAPCSGHGAKKT